MIRVSFWNERRFVANVKRKKKKEGRLRECQPMNIELKLIDKVSIWLNKIISLFQNVHKLNQNYWK